MRARFHGAARRFKPRPALTIDSGWQEVAEVALAFVKQHHPAFIRSGTQYVSMPSEGTQPLTH